MPEAPAARARPARYACRPSNARDSRPAHRRVRAHARRARVMGAAPRFVTADEVAALGFAEAAGALAAGLAGRSPGTLDPVPRRAIELPAGQDEGGDRELLVMPCHGPEGVGVKLVTVAPDNPERHELPRIQGAYVLFTPDGLTPRLVIDGAALTRLRTAAVSALATRL